MSYPFTLTDKQLSVFVYGKPYSVDPKHPHWEQLLDIVKGKSPTPIPERMQEMLNVRTSIETRLKTYGSDRIKVGADQIIIDGSPSHSYCSRRIMDMLKAGVDITPWIRFLDRCLLNPSKSIFDELFQWMEGANMPVTPDGCFLAYKKVDDDLQSYHPSPDGSHLQHRLNERLEMPRYQVDDIRENTCSTGLHFCGWSYLSSYYGSRGKVLLLLIDPADVVSIPVDYDFQKGRACAYVPLMVMPNEDVKDFFAGSYVFEANTGRSLTTFEAGDKVRCVEAFDTRDVTEGNVYTVKGSDDGEQYIYDDVGDMNDAPKALFALVEDEPPLPTGLDAFKGGDIVICLADDGGYLTEGRTYTVHEDWDGDPYINDDDGDRDYGEDRTFKLA